TALEETYVDVGTAIAKSVLKLWAKDVVLDNDNAASLIDLLKSQTSDIIAQRKGQRQFDIIGERIVENLFPLFESEGARLSNGARAAIAIAVGEAFNKAKISRSLLAEYNLEPSKLTHHVLDANMDIMQYFELYEKSLYEHIIKDACGYVI